MRIPAGAFANAAAWGVFAVLIAASLAIADRLGFLGLFLLGGATWLICVRASQSNDTPTWGQRAFEAQMTGERSPEARAARLAERDAALNPLRFFGRCGMALTAIGTIGFAWQYWFAVVPNGH